MAIVWLLYAAVLLGELLSCLQASKTVISLLHELNVCCLFVVSCTRNATFYCICFSNAYFICFF